MAHLCQFVELLLCRFPRQYSQYQHLITTYRPFKSADFGHQALNDGIGIARYCTLYGLPTAVLALSNNGASVAFTCSEQVKWFEVGWVEESIQLTSIQQALLSHLSGPVKEKMFRWDKWISVARTYVGVGGARAQPRVSSRGKGQGGRLWQSDQTRREQWPDEGARGAGRCMDGRATMLA